MSEEQKVNIGKEILEWIVYILSGYHCFIVAEPIIRTHYSPSHPCRIRCLKGICDHG